MSSVTLVFPEPSWPRRGEQSFISTSGSIERAPRPSLQEWNSPATNKDNPCFVRDSYDRASQECKKWVKQNCFRAGIKRIALLRVVQPSMGCLLLWCNRSRAETEVVSFVLVIFHRLMEDVFGWQSTQRLRDFLESILIIGDGFGTLARARA
jgi:hypothetical protein